MRSWLNRLALLGLLLAAAPVFAQSRIDQLASGAAVNTTDSIPNCQGCNSTTPMVATTFTQIKTWMMALFSGDITFNSSGVGTIANNAVTTAKIVAAAVSYARMQNGASTGLLGVNSAAAPSEVAVGAGLTLLGGTLAATGSGVDGGTASVALTASCILGTGGSCSSHSIRLVKIASGWATGTITLDAIANVSSDTCVRIEDGGNFVDGTHTLTVTANAADKLNGGSAGGNTGAIVSNGARVDACVTATNNWNVSISAIVATTAPSHQFFNSISAQAVFGSAQPAVSDISGFGTGVATALGNNLSANGGLTKTVFSGAKALATGAISSAACTSAQTDTATGTLTTDVVLASFNGDPTAVTGYVPLTTGMLTIIAYPTADTVNFKICNNTSGSITPGAITLNWRVVR